MTEPLAHSGFIALAGRPNAGKSTLVNAIVGAKVAIVSDKPQTTRRAIRGVASGPDWQLVLVDLPGVQRPRDKLTERMQRRLERELDEADAVLVVLDGAQPVGPGDRFIAHALARSPTRVVVAVNKLDRLTRAATAAALTDAAEAFGDAAEYFPVSARRGTGIGPLVGRLVELMPAGPPYFEPGARTDLPRHVLLAELIREQVLARTHQEVPHSVEVQVDDVTDDGTVTRVRAYVWAETESQKGILIGAGGRMIKAIGTAARRELERELGAHVHLDLSVRLRKRWRADDALLDRLGIE